MNMLVCNFRKLMIAVVLLITPFVSFASSNITGKVTNVGTYGDGSLFVMLNGTIDESGCNNNRFDIPAGHAEIKSWLAIAMLAVATGKDIHVATTGCYGIYPTIDENTKNGFFYIKGD